MSPEFIYEERDKIDDIISQTYPDLNKIKFPEIDSNNIKLIRQLVFIEGIDFLFRALNFCQIIQYSLAKGFYTASQSLSYQASFFGARAILGLSGVYCSEIQNKNFILDAYHTQTDTLEEFQLNSIKRNHQIIWKLFEKILSLTTVDETIIESRITNIIKNINYQNCTNLRHNIHYYNKYTFEDLFNPIKYQIKSIDNIKTTDINNNCAYFDMLCIFLLFGSNLYLTIAEHAAGLRDLSIKFNNIINKDRNPILASNNFYEKLKKTENN